MISHRAELCRATRKLLGSSFAMHCSAAHQHSQLRAPGIRGSFKDGGRPEVS